ncbi:52.2 kDa DNA-directed RNA polymerase II subunit 1 [Spodoptera frugiperda ascovirus 1a]|uniref:DNA-directed RNA polymerase n=1 Tax=Spodoptera frugiperda ascovirus 1a TaxID=113370 RepID=Q0E534_SFAVA|nr:52.2 kDa DNA-directed RNA polymerase II subunit 1 [Spodoptera frugiperda ascovirus 1a]CAL44667.1 52.2 kDa DNA-directed RNA polymerase II subunit 1 [Spodoptera frugiperda ascovirus 1a]
MQTGLVTLTRDGVLMDKLLDFIRRRPHVPVEVEEQRVVVLRNRYARMLQGARVPHDSLARLKRLLHDRYLKELATPGDCVGVACAQFIGECITQSTLNTFHAAGMDTGIVSTMRKIEDIINLPKGGTTFVTLYPADERWSFREFYERTRHHVECVTVKDAMRSFDSDGERIHTLTLDLHVLFRYRIDEVTIESRILETLTARYANVIVEMDSYDSLTEADESVTVRIIYECGRGTWYAMRRLLIGTGLVGVGDVSGPHRYIRNDDDDNNNNGWCLELCCKSMSRQLSFSNRVYDPFKTRTNRLRDVESGLGVEAAKNAIIEISGECLSESVPSAIIQLLSMILTRSGTVEPCTRFTMRSNTSPLAKIGFEECLEGCRNAGLYAEVERFNTVSSSVICGVSPHVGSNYSEFRTDVPAMIGNVTHMSSSEQWVEHRLLSNETGVGQREHDDYGDVEEERDDGLL